MAKSVYDLAVLLDAISKPESPFISHLNGSWEELSVATLDPYLWKFPDSYIKPVAEADNQIVTSPLRSYNERDLTVTIVFGDRCSIQYYQIKGEKICRKRPSDDS